jgi:NADPH:quinone reductase-like Zn-dependent oxidoreductase
VFSWRRALKPRGVYLTFGGPARLMLTDALLGPIYSRIVGRKLGMAFVLPFKPEDRTRLAELVAAGVLKPVIDRRFSLDEAREALLHVHHGHARGKVLIVP